MAKTKLINAEMKALNGEVRTITAIVTSNLPDRDGDVVDIETLRFPLKGGGYVLGKDLDGSQVLDVPFLIDHDFSVENMLGAWQSGRYLGTAIELEAGISTREKAQDLMRLFDEGFVGNNFSITMSDFEYKDGHIKGAEVIECSFVFKGSNREAKLQLVKAFAEEGEIMPEEIKVEPVVETETPEIKEEAEVKPEPQPEVKPEAEPEVKPEAEAEPEAEPEIEEEIKEIKEEGMSKDIAVKQVKDPVEVEAVAKTFSNKEIRENFAEQFVAKFVSKDDAAFQNAREKAFEIAGVSKAVLGGGSSADALYLPNLVATDLIKCYEANASYAKGVDKLDITGQVLVDLPVLTGSGKFERVGRGQAKPYSAPALSNVRIEPREWATIVPWYDYVQKNSKMAVYNLIINYIAEAYALTEDEIVLNYAGGAVVGESNSDPASGLVPLLTTAGRVVSASSLSGADLVNAIAEALGMIKGTGIVEVGTNRATWMRVVTATNGLGNYIANVDGSITVGGAGTIRPVFTDALADGAMVFGIRSQYAYVTNGGLSTLFSQEAFLEDAIANGTDLNLFRQDASAIRADFWAFGAPKCLNSFALVEVPILS